MAKEKGLAYEETVEISAMELRETEVGKAVDSQTRSSAVWRLAFTSLKEYEPVLAVDIDGYQYLVLKVEDIPDVVPSFEDCRDEVVAAWKIAESRKLAKEKGDAIAKQAKEEGSSLAAAVDQDEFEMVTTDFFSHFTFGNTPAEMQRGPRLSEVPPLTAIGPQFLNATFKLADEDVVALPNFDGSAVYVVRIAQKERTQDELRQAFLETVNTSYEMQMMDYIRSQQTQRALLGQVFQRAGYNPQVLQQSLQRSAAQ